jgi:hypothetical protein
MAGRRFMPRTLGAAIVLLSLGSLSGCSLIGLGVGSMVDSGRRVGPAARLTSTRPGCPVSVRLEDGREVSGVFAGTGQIPAADCAADYEAWRRSMPATRLPMLGESLVCLRARWDSTGFRSESSALRGRFRGVGYQFVAPGIVGEAEPVRIPLEEIESVTDSAGNRASWLGDVRQGVSRGDFPLLTSFNVGAGNGVERIRLDQVSSVERSAPRTGKIIGFSLWLLMDGAAIAVAVAMSSAQLW